MYIIRCYLVAADEDIAQVIVMQAPVWHKQVQKVTQQ